MVPTESLQFPLAGQLSVNKTLRLNGKKLIIKYFQEGDKQPVGQIFHYDLYGAEEECTDKSDVKRKKIYIIVLNKRDPKGKFLLPDLSTFKQEKREELQSSHLYLYIDHCIPSTGPHLKLPNYMPCTVLSIPLLNLAKNHDKQQKLEDKEKEKDKSKDKEKQTSLSTSVPSASSLSWLSTRPAATKRKFSPPTLTVVDAPVADNGNSPPTGKKQTKFLKTAEIHSPIKSIKPKKISNLLQQERGLEKLRSWVEEPTQQNLLRPHQIEVICQYFEAGRKQGIRNAVFEQTPGTGKTRISGALAQITGETMLFLVPRRELIHQTAASFQETFPTLKITTQFDSWDLKQFEENDIVVGTYQSVDYKERYKEIPADIISLIILDEGHNALSEKKGKMIAYFEEHQCSVIAMTASPRITRKKEKGEEKAWCSVYHILGFKDPSGLETTMLSASQVPPRSFKDNPVKPLDIKLGIDKNINAPIVTSLIQISGIDKKAFSHKTKRDGDKKNISQKREITEEVSAKATDTPESNQDIVDLYMNGRDQYSSDDGIGEPSIILGKPFRGEQGIVFCSGVNHAIHMAEAFNAISIESVDPDNKLRNQYADNLYQAKLADLKKRFERKPCNQGKLFVVDKNTEARLQKEAHEIAVGQPSKEGFCIANAVYGNSAEHILSSDKSSKMIRQFKLGGTLLLTGSDMLTEGLDHAGISWTCRVRVSRSEKFCIQSTGRGSRLNPEDPHKVHHDFCIFVPGLSNLRYPFHRISNGGLTPKFSYGDDKIKLARQAYQSLRLTLSEPAFIPVGSIKEESTEKSYTVYRAFTAGPLDSALMNKKSHNKKRKYDSTQESPDSPSPLLFSRKLEKPTLSPLLAADLSTDGITEEDEEIDICTVSPRLTQVNDEDEEVDVHTASPRVSPRN